MKVARKTQSLVATLLIAVFLAPPSIACSMIAAGKKATVDGTTILSHNDDTLNDNFHLKIIPEAEHKDGAKRDMVKDAHGYPGQEVVLGQIPQAKRTNRYFFSNYSLMNDKSVAFAEVSNTVLTPDARAKKVHKIMSAESQGMMDAFMVQDVALERASSAREAVKIVGDLITEHGWYPDRGETMGVADGEEVWLIDIYGNKQWAAWRVPDDEVAVVANRARLRNIDLTDKRNVMHSPDLVEYAVANGFIDQKDVNLKDFSPADVYSPSPWVHSSRREWRGLDLLAPSQKFNPSLEYYPKSVKPDNKVSVHDVFKIMGDWMEGTPYDLSKGVGAGPWGNPLRYTNKSKENPKAEWIRSFNMHRTAYVFIAQISSDTKLPKEVRGIAWYGYGAADTTYLTPLWPIMKQLPAFYQTGTRYEDFRRDSGWWVNTYVQQMADMRYQPARKVIHAARDPKLFDLYQTAPVIQQKAGELIKAGKREEAVNMITNFAYSNAVDWNQQWLKLGDHLLGRFALGAEKGKAVNYPEWWNKEAGFIDPIR